MKNHSSSGHLKEHSQNQEQKLQRDALVAIRKKLLGKKLSYKEIYSVMDQITKDQINEVNKYGKKLNPLAMFYMIIAVILPSLGVTMLIILSSFIKFELSLAVLVALACFLGFVQFMFIAMVKFSRPAIEF